MKNYGKLHMQREQRMLQLRFTGITDTRNFDESSISFGILGERTEKHITFFFLYINREVGSRSNNKNRKRKEYIAYGLIHFIFVLSIYSIIRLYVG